MSTSLPVPSILGAAQAAVPGFLADLSYPLGGLLLVGATLVLVVGAMVLIRLALRRWRLAAESPGPVLVPVVAAAVPPEIVAVLTAAVSEALEGGGNIVAITPAEGSQAAALAWSSEGRREHFASHKVR